MGLSIKNDEVERLARELAGLRGVSITEAIKQSLEATIATEKSEQDALFQELIAISDRVAALPRNELTDDEILGYDEFGAPTR